MFYTCSLIDCYFHSSLKNGDRIFYLPNLKGVGNRLQVFSGLYVLSYHYRIPIVSKITLLDAQYLVPLSAGWDQVWNIKQSFPNQIIYISDDG